MLRAPSSPSISSLMHHGAFAATHKCKKTVKENESRDHEVSGSGITLGSKRDIVTSVHKC